MTPPLVIRTARASDAKAIADFNVFLALETEHQRLDPDTVRAGVEAVLNDPGKGMYFVAESDGRVVGQCSITFEWSDWRNGMFWWLQSVYIESIWRRQGVFHALFEHVRQAAVAAGIIGLRLYVEDENISAQTVYQRRGMTRARYQVFEMMLKPGPPG